jgi:hypothetical protein
MRNSSYNSKFFVITIITTIVKCCRTIGFFPIGFLTIITPADISASHLLAIQFIEIAVNRPPWFTAEPTPYSLSTTTDTKPKQMLLNAVPLIMVGGTSGGITVIIATGENPLQSPTSITALTRVVT